MWLIIFYHDTQLHNVSSYHYNPDTHLQGKRREFNLMQSQEEFELEQSTSHKTDNVTK